MKKKGGKLKDRKLALILDLRNSGLNFNQLAKKYGVTRQGMHFFYGVHKEEVGERHFPPRKPTVRGHEVERCKYCKKIIKLSRKKWSYLTWSLGMIGREVGLSNSDLYYHLSRLRKAEMIPYHFGRLLSDRGAQAYRIYLSEAIPVSKIGEMVGLKNFGSIIAMHRYRGFVVPDGLFKWDTETRRKAAIAINQKKMMHKTTASQQARSKSHRKGK
jgi:hypothetical protein